MMNTNLDIIPATVDDADILMQMFYANLETHRGYISHGEVQMGVGKLTFDGEKYVPSVVPESRPLWHTYIMEHINAEDMAVFKAVQPDGTLAGFCVLEDSEDGGEHFGVLCDILVNPAIRGRGIGSALLDTALEWFASRGLKDVYLESGKDNHPAHEFFMSKGFFKVSEVYAKIGK
ncbi:MAG: GNAT family N-acetyltransferase [Candidatus Cryptobacteroides sp.]|nr:GNAT family N-acetyltransferase [Bacteroidales bacterium]